MLMAAVRNALSFALLIFFFTLSIGLVAFTLLGLDFGVTEIFMGFTATFAVFLAEVTGFLVGVSWKEKQQDEPSEPEKAKRRPVLHLEIIEDDPEGMDDSFRRSSFRNSGRN